MTLPALVPVANGGPVYNDTLVSTINNSAGVPAIAIRLGASIRLIRLSDGQEVARAGTIIAATSLAQSFVTNGWV